MVPGAKSQLAVPLRNKGQVIGALNLLSDKLGAFTERDEWILRQFGAHVAQAIATARLFESEREYAETLETLAEIGREMSAILDPDELLTRLAHLIKRVIDYRIFGIALLDEETQMLELKVDDQVRRRSAGDGAGEARRGPGRLRRAAQGSGAGAGRDEGSALHRRRSRRPLGAGGAAAAEGSLHRRVRSREPGAGRVQQEARQAADAAGVGSGGGDRERPARTSRFAPTKRGSKRSCGFAQRVQMALLPQELPKRLRGVDVAWHFDPARELGGDLCDFLSPEPNTLVVALGDVSGKGVPAALYGAAIGEMIRGRTFRRRLEKKRSTPAAVLGGHEPHPPRAQPRGVLLHALLRDVRVQEADRDVRQLGTAVPGEVHRTARPRRSTCRACRSDRSAARPTTTSQVPLAAGDVFVLCSDGIFEAFDEAGRGIRRRRA